MELALYTLALVQHQRARRQAASQRTAHHHDPHPSRTHGGLTRRQ
jgi:hypothetical protein